MFEVSLAACAMLLLCGEAGASSCPGEQSQSQGSHRVLRPQSALTSFRPEEQNNTEVVAQVGSTARIRCYTHFLGNALVTWTKSDEEFLLTVGERIYTSEPRYFISHVRHQKLWELSIRSVRASDAGAYECQVTSHPLAAIYFFLRVVEARAVVPDGGALHSHAGVQLRLPCRVDQATEPVSHFFWYHNGTGINFSKTRSLTIVTHGYCSYVVIENVTWADSGVYTCAPLRARPANLTLHVLQDEQRSALYNGRGEGGFAAAASVLPPVPPTWLLVACLVGARPSC
ncbi:uncharacterized protein LOC134788153 [Penaeus indicus]|uniref:uncharacterized protein LOC134788153 n=1 Tax=Penaeus indicus TaxID=29960 RepID=UPI00300DAB8D